MEKTFLVTVCDGSRLELEMGVIEELFGLGELYKRACITNNAEDITDDEDERLTTEIDRMYNEVLPYLDIVKGSRYFSKDVEGLLDGDYFDDYEITYNFELVRRGSR